MEIIFIGVTVILMFILCFLMRKVLILSDRCSEYEDKIKKLPDGSIWHKFDELISNLSHIHNLGLLSSEEEAEKVFYKTVLDSTCSILNSMRGSLMIYDEKSNSLKIVASMNISRESQLLTEIKPGTGVAGRAFATGETIFVTNPEFNSQYEEFLGKDDQKDPFISLPLKIKGRSVGVLNVHLMHEQKAFTEQDLKFLNLITAEISITLENKKLYKDLENFYAEMIETLGRVIDAKDIYSGGHAEDARMKARMMCEVMKIPVQERHYIEYAALLHDIGKMALDKELLSKQGRLTPEEYEKIKQHPLIGYKILSPVEFLIPVAKLVLYHQEWYNGMGYPNGLKGNEIPLGSRIISVIDAWEAMNANRPYRSAVDADVAETELLRGAGNQFDPDVVDVFLKLEKAGWRISAV